MPPSQNEMESSLRTEIFTFLKGFIQELTSNEQSIFISKWSKPMSLLYRIMHIASKIHLIQKHEKSRPFTMYI